VVPPAEGRLSLGTLIKPWGVRGEQTLRLHNPASDLLEQVDAVFVEGDGFPARPVGLRQARWVGKRYVVHLEDIDDPADAEALRGLDVSVPVEWLPDLEEEGEYYVRDLLGLQVVDQHGAPLGELVDVFPTGSNDVYVVKGPQGEILIPAIQDIILDVDLEQRRMQVHHEEL